MVPFTSGDGDPFSGGRFKRFMGIGVYGYDGVQPGSAHPSIPLPDCFPGSLPHGAGYQALYRRVPDCKGREGCLQEGDWRHVHPGLYRYYHRCHGHHSCCLNPYPDSSEDYHIVYLLVYCTGYHRYNPGTHHIKFFTCFPQAAQEIRAERDPRQDFGENRGPHRREGKPGGLCDGTTVDCPGLFGGEERPGRCCRSRLFIILALAPVQPGWIQDCLQHADLKPPLYSNGGRGGKWLTKVCWRWHTKNKVWWKF